MWILLVSRLIIPELVDTIFKLSNNIPEYVKEIQALLEKTSMNKPMVHKYVNQITFDWDKISGELITFLQDGATSMLNSTVSAITDVVQFIVLHWDLYLHSMHCFRKKNYQCR